MNVRAKKAASIRRADLFASLDRLAEVGQRLDGPYRLGAAYIRGQLKAGAATRLKRRAEMILDSASDGIRTNRTTKPQRKSRERSTAMRIRPGARAERVTSVNVV